MAERADALRKNWLAALAHERRASPHTLRAYGDDVARFIGFQTTHIGGTVSEKALAKPKTYEKLEAISAEIEASLRLAAQETDREFERPSYRLVKGCYLLNIDFF